MFYLSTNLQWFASYRRKTDISAFAVPKGVNLNRCFWRHLLFSAVYSNCYRNSEQPVTRIARSLVQEIVIKFLAQGNVKYFVGMDQVQKKLLCVTPEQDVSVWSVLVWPVTVTGHFGMAVSVMGHFGHDISVHKQLITFVHLNVYRQAKCHASCCYTNSFEGSWLRWNLNCNYDFEEFGFTSKCRCWFNLLAHDNENHMLMLINCWILDHVCNFSNKISSWFKYICINTEQARFLQDFIVWPKCPQTETAQTETAQTESARPKSRLPMLHNIWLHLTKTTPLICILVKRINRFIA